MARGQKDRTANVMLYCTGNKYENFLIDSQSFTKNWCILQATRDPKSCPITIVRRGYSTAVWNEAVTLIVPYS